MSLYQRNDLYISAAEQNKLKNYRILLGGCGIGSNIAECALRLGFENLTLVDGDSVDLTNLNRQNYLRTDMHAPKTAALKRRLLDINPAANISATNVFLDKNNITSFLTGHQVAINALDFQSNIPFLFDELCQKQHMHVLHPYNIGWATLVFVIAPHEANLSSISNDYLGFEKKVGSFLIDRLEGSSKQWVQKILSGFEQLDQGQSPPQLSVGSWLAAASCTDILYKLATGKPVKVFPEFYYVTLEP